VVAGFIVQSNFSNLTSGVLAVAAPRYRGATIGVYSCIGFGAGFLGTLLFGITLDQFGGTSQLAAWGLSFGSCGLAWPRSSPPARQGHPPSASAVARAPRGGEACLGALADQGALQFR
jgi:hypothetical protein